MAWAKGAANPRGRPVTKPFTDMMRFLLSEAGDDPHKLRRITQKVLDMAEEGNLEAAKYVIDRMDGKVPQPVDLEQTVLHIAIDERKNRIKELQNKAITTTYQEVEDNER